LRHRESRRIRHAILVSRLAKSDSFRQIAAGASAKYLSQNGGSLDLDSRASPVVAAATGSVEKA